MVLVLKKERVGELMKHPYFNQTVSDEVIRLFLSGEINFFWSSRTVSGIGTDVFVYDAEGLASFCLFEGPLRGFIQSRPGETQDAFNFRGEKVTFNRDVRECADGFIFSKPALNKGAYWGGVPRDDLLFMSHIVFDTNGFYRNLSNEFWKKIAEQLVREHGPNVDLAKYNVLNTIFTYQTNKQGLPPETIQKIQERTKQELAALRVAS